MKIEVPAKVKDCELWQLYQFAHLDHSKANDHRAAEYMAEVLSIFCELPEADIMDLRPEDVKPAYIHVMKMMGGLKWDSVPPESLEVEGVKYTRRSINEKQWTFGQLVDMSNTDFKRQSERLAAMIYIEEGRTYGNTDMSERAKVFIDHFPREVYAQCVAFFFAWRKISMLKDTDLLKRMKKATKVNQKALKEVNRLMNGQG